MIDAQKLIADVMRAHSPGGMIPIVCPCGWRATAAPITESHRQHVSAEIDKALGGLTRQWSVRYTDGHVATRPSPGLPSPEMVERAGKFFADRELVIGWVSGWAEVQQKESDR